MTSTDYDFQDFRVILREHMAKRQKANPRYSLRAFSRDIDIPHNRLSEVLNGKQGLSREVAHDVAKRLGMSSVEQSFFCDLVDSQHARSETPKQIARLRLLKYAESLEFHQLRLDSFHLIADWYHLAIIELLTLPCAKSDLEWIASSLDISKEEADSAIKRLIRLGMLAQEDTKLLPTKTRTETVGGIPSSAIKHFHSQIIQKSLSAIMEQDIDRREYSTAILSIPISKLEDAKQQIKKFTKSFCQSMNQNIPKDEVYALSVQFFQLSELKKDKQTWG